MGSSSSGAGFGTYMATPPTQTGTPPWAPGFQNPGYGAGFMYSRPYNPGELSGGVAPPSFSLQSNSQAPTGVGQSSPQAVAQASAMGGALLSPFAAGPTGWQEAQVPSSFVPYQGTLPSGALNTATGLPSTSFINILGNMANNPGFVPSGSTLSGFGMTLDQMNQAVPSYLSPSDITLPTGAQQSGYNSLGVNYRLPGVSGAQIAPWPAGSFHP